MIRASDECVGRTPRQDDPRAVLLAITRHLGEPVLADPTVQQAQQWVDEAWEASSPEQEQRLILRALSLDPLNVGALLQALAYAGLTGDEEIEVLRNIVAAGEKRLGPALFQERTGLFWGFEETRPYMRVRQRLAETLRLAGRLEEAVVEFEALLRLNPNDNQGVRLMLLPTYLRLRRLADAERLFTQYSQEADLSVVFAWGRVLARFMSGEGAGAVRALATARKQNPFLLAYLKDNRPLPAALPTSYAPGSKEEALCFAAVLREAWAAHPEARRWLYLQK